ncbi:MAG TPA: hypothetical protein PLT50_03715 [bacterium]|jgi:hypothetical protein|nr:hypothetical protein [bacterium]
MIIDQTIDRRVGKILLDEYLKNKKEHIPSGKLSASMLGKPLQSQILKTIGVPSKDLDEYVVRKFRRGEHVEAWVVSQLKNLITPKTNIDKSILLQEKGLKWDKEANQWQVEYNGVIGYCDSIVDTSDYEYKIGLLTNEIKSVTNANFKWIQKRKEINLGHALQGALYGLAIGQAYFAVTYVASDDYRILMMVEETSKYKQQIHDIINRYNEQIRKRVVPIFEAVEKWQENPQYADYPEFMSLNEEEIAIKLKDYDIKWPEQA